MSDLEFDRESVGVSAKKDWRDSEEFSRIATFLAQLYASTAVQNLPSGDNAGVGNLRGSLNDFRSVLTDVLQEYGDACATLGSGQESAIANHDAAEVQNIEKFRELADRLGG
ncbi:MAG: hypothetical protein CSA82_00910 [Actinobacteria bacterium]|nr:MAG: hypothetical protein CSA82_00910 [Actinomycetota bacterium]